MQKNSIVKQRLWVMVGAVLGYAIVFGLLTASGVVDLRQREGRVMAIVMATSMLCAAPFLPHCLGINSTPDKKQMRIRPLDLKVILASWIALLAMTTNSSWRLPASIGFLGLLIFAWCKERAARRRAGK